MDYSQFIFSATVDWIDVAFHTATPTQAMHVQKNSRFSHVTGCDPTSGMPYKTGRKNTTTTRFIGRMHDPQIHSAVMMAIETCPRIDIQQPITIFRIEVALDAYARTPDTNLDAMTVHLYRSLARPASKRQKLYHDKYPADILKQRDDAKLAEKLRDGWGIGIGNKRDNHYQRLYTKRTDSNSTNKLNSNNLPLSEHRARVENQILCGEFGDAFGNLMLQSCKRFRFDKLSKHFSFRMPADNLTNIDQMIMDSKPYQIGALYEQKRKGGGGNRLYQRQAPANRKLNKLASDALRRLSQRWQG